MFKTLLTTTLLVGSLGATAPALAGEHHGDREWRKPLHHERLERHERRRLRHVERRAYRDTRRKLLRAERHGERRAWREWRRAHHDRRYRRVCRNPDHAHLHPRPWKHGYGHYRWRHEAPAYRYRYHGVTYRHEGVDPLPIIGGGVIGGVIGNELGDGDPAAATAGLFIGSIVGYELGRH